MLKPVGWLRYRQPLWIRVSSSVASVMDETNSLIEQRKAKLAALRAKGA